MDSEEELSENWETDPSGLLGTGLYSTTILMVLELVNKFKDASEVNNLERLCC